MVILYLSNCRDTSRRRIDDNAFKTCILRFISLSDLGVNPTVSVTPGLHPTSFYCIIALNETESLHHAVIVVWMV